MKITYSISPMQIINRYPMASRILSSNLIRNPRLDVTFSKAVMLTNSVIKKRTKELMTDETIRDLQPTLKVFLRNIMAKASPFFVSTAINEFTDKIINLCPDDIVLATCFSPYDLYFIKMLLDAGKRVVLGGSLVFLGPNPEKTIRNSLLLHGVKKEAVLKNLIIVKGYVDLYTDLYRIINEWTDVRLADSNIESMWDCNFDYLHSDLFQMFTRDWNQVCFAFNDKCWWNKCKFCNYSKLSQINYIENADDTKIIDHINKQLMLYKSNEIKFIDNYFRFTDRTKHILKSIDGVERIGIYTGIPFLKDPEFIENLNKYKISLIHVGLESTSDFTLDKIRKGYQFKDIVEATNNLVKNISKDIVVSMMLIMDLPAKSIDDIKAAYKKLTVIKDTMLNAGIRFDYSAGLLQISPGIEIVDNEYIRLVDEFTYECSGEGYLTKAFMDMGLPGHLPFITNAAYHRYGDDGNRIPSDLELIDENELNSILNFERDYDTN
jgi:hypothetical protein